MVHSTDILDTDDPERVYVDSEVHISSSGPALSDAVKGSVTVTSDEHVALLPLSSVAVTVTVTTPRSAHVKSLLLSVTEAIAQLSTGALASSSEGSIVAFPDASSSRVISVQLMTGSSVSFTVMVKMQVETIPSSSVEVYVTVVMPVLKVAPGRWVDTMGAVETGGVQLTTAEQEPGSVLTLISAGQSVITGGSLSSIFIVTL